MGGRWTLNYQNWAGGIRSFVYFSLCESWLDRSRNDLFSLVLSQPAPDLLQRQPCIPVVDFPIGRCTSFIGLRGLLDFLPYHLAFLYLDLLC